MDIKQLSLYVMAGFYFLAGVNHFIMPKFYLKIMPPYLPKPKLLNLLSGFAEMLLAILLLFSITSHWAAWGIIVLLCAVFPANIYHHQRSKNKALTLIRLPMQFLFIAWAWWHTF
ncbi:MAG: DoxX family protein [Flammeovirgaceae bacterium]